MYAYTCCRSTKCDAVLLATKHSTKTPNMRYTVLIPDHPLSTTRILMEVAFVRPMDLGISQRLDQNILGNQGELSPFPILNSAIYAAHTIPVVLWPGPD